MHNRSLLEYKRNVTLVWDEMKIKSGIAVSRQTGKLLGFCSVEGYDLGIDNLNSLESEPELTSHNMVFMVRGIMCKANVPFVWYPCKSLLAL